MGFIARPAHAAGGADVVDDAFVEAPNTCHIETWFAGALQGNTLSHIGVGCTPKAARNLELDAAIDRQTGNGAADTLIKPAVKYTLIAQPASFSLGIDGGMVLNNHGRLEGASLIVPASFTLGKHTTLNANLGGLLTCHPHGRDRGDLFWGAQIAQAFAPHFTAIGEIFGTAAERPGEQAGLRWSPGPQKIDVDLRGSHGPGHAGSAMTLGLTVRI